MSTSTVVDYPFSNWTDYFKAVLLSCQTEFYFETYPEYHAVCQSEKTDMGIMFDILSLHPTKEWAQEGLDEMIKTVVNAPRYSSDFAKNKGPIIEKMISLGAVADLTYVVTKFRHVEYGFEEDSYSFSCRGVLLSLFEKLGVEMPSVIKNATPVYWEDASENWATKADEPKQDTEEYMKHFYNGIKYCMVPESNSAY
jgi:hypothetical protein